MLLLCAHIIIGLARNVCFLRLSTSRVEQAISRRKWFWCKLRAGYPSENPRQFPVAASWNGLCIAIVDDIIKIAVGWQEQLDGMKTALDA